MPQFISCTRAVAFALAASALSLALPVHGDEQEGGDGAYFNFYGGNAIFDSAALLGLDSVNNAGAFGGRVGKRLTGHIGLELDLSSVLAKMQTVEGEGDESESQYSGALVGVLYAFDSESTPFLTFGLGGSSNRFGGREERTSSLLGLWGLGYKHRIGNHFDLRLDAQHRLLFNAMTAEGGQTLNNLSFTGGLAYHFGETKKLPKPREAENAVSGNSVDAAPVFAVMPSEESSLSESETSTQSIKIVLPSASFATDSAVLSPEAKKRLLGVVRFSRNYPESKIAVEGHTDSTGSYRYNLWLSEKRAWGVVDYLVEQGVASDSLHAQGYADTRPIASNNSAEGRAENRRVEVHSEVEIERRRTVLP